MKLLRAAQRHLSWHHLVIAGFVVLPLVIIAAVPTNSDVAWLLYVAERVLDGATLYRDVIESNPPLIVHLSLVPVWLAKSLGVYPAYVYHGFVIGLALISLGVQTVVLRRLFPDLETRTRRLFLTGLAFAMFILPGFSFGQREHIMLIGLLPYLWSAAGRSSGMAVSMPVGVVVGLLAGVGFALKPHFLIIWLSVEALVLWSSSKSNRLALIYRWENRVIAFVLFAYLVSVLVITPDYVTIAGLFGKLYATYRLPALEELFLGSLPIFSVATLVAWWLYPLKGAYNQLGRFLSVAIAATLVVALIQQKGWFYHYLPSFGTSTLLLTMIVATSVESSRRIHTIVRAVAVFLLVILTLLALGVTTDPGTGALANLGLGLIAGTVLTLLFLGLDRFIRLPRLKVPLFAGVMIIGFLVIGPRLGYQLPGTQYYGEQHRELVKMIEARDDEITLLVFSTHIHRSFPLVNITGSRWPLRFNSMWPLALTYANRMEGTGEYQYRTPAEMGPAELFFWNATIEDIRRSRPDLVVVDETGIGGGDFSFMDYFRRAESIERMFGEMCLTREMGELRVFKRGSCRAQPSRS